MRNLLACPLCVLGDHFLHRADWCWVTSWTHNKKLLRHKQSEQLIAYLQGWRNGEWNECLLLLRVTDYINRQRGWDLSICLDGFRLSLVQPGPNNHSVTQTPVAPFPCHSHVMTRFGVSHNHDNRCQSIVYGDSPSEWKEELWIIILRCWLFLWALPCPQPLMHNISILNLISFYFLIEITHAAYNIEYSPTVWCIIVV